jgi:hypothetical protein
MAIDGTYGLNGDALSEAERQRQLAAMAGGMWKGFPVQAINSQAPTLKYSKPELTIPAPDVDIPKGDFTQGDQPVLRMGSPAPPTPSLTVPSASVRTSALGTAPPSDQPMLSMGSSAQPSPPLRVPSASERYQESLSKPLPSPPTFNAPKLKWWQKAGDIALSTIGNAALPGLGTRISSAIPGTRENYNQQYGAELQNFGQQEKTAKEQSGILKASADEERLQAEELRKQTADANKLDPRTPTVESGGQAYQWNPESGRYDVPIGKPKPQRFTNPFEAFAFGDANERKAAQDFIALEKRLGRENDKPGEIEQRYSLYKRDPDAYREMFGDKGAAQGSRDEAQAARMLKFFDGQRKQIQGDFTLDDTEKQRQLAEIQALEKPYLDAAKVGGPSGNKNASANGGGPRAGEVEVISPSGQRGYIPRANLKKALGRGYTQANP